jgi:hypothetical protein
MFTNLKKGQPILVFDIVDNVHNTKIERLLCRKMIASNEKSLHTCNTLTSRINMPNFAYGYDTRLKHTEYIYNVDVHKLIHNTQSTSSCLFENVNTADHTANCPPPPAANREAIRSKYYPGVQLTWADRLAGKHTQNSGQYQSSSYRRGANKPAPY